MMMMMYTTNREVTHYAIASIPHSQRVGRENAVGITTNYGLDDPGSNPVLGGARLSVTVLTGPKAHPASCKMGNRISFPIVKQLGSGADIQQPFSAEVKERD